MENNTTNIEANFYLLLGEKIRTARKLKGLDQESFASSIDLSRTSQVNIEKGRQRPSIYQLLLMAQVLGIPFIDLIPKDLIPSGKSEELKSYWEIKIDDTDRQIHHEDKTRLLDFISVTRSLKN